ncbi:SDR family oxidoreductase [Sediminibacterium roseum]|uniref:SDR family oxidoreductase n=1 Tax=Sediminibacterium roseum TaxID=1978412 RepID=A0ABW9ZYI6_9BACT|nr:SDR family oxidoreductase [Sediminibacterium roseum]NCI52134.1 SDR family oxidoreductase [Sediminibacterium roseum]
MNLQIKDHLFIVSGATSGFGKAIAEALIAEGANIIAVARGEEKLKALQSAAPAQVEIFAGSMSDQQTIDQLKTIVGKRQLHGMVVNAGGPPAKTVLETTLEDWDNAYLNILRWKVALTQTFVPAMMEHRYGRVVYIESSSVKQPLENLVLSNSLRVAVVGMVKTLSQEIAKSGVTLNILGPGSHNTPAIDRIYHKKSEQTGMPFAEVKEKAIAQIPVGALGEATDFASLALWLLSPMSRYVTGETITVDGGSVKNML